MDEYVTGFDRFEETIVIMIKRRTRQFCRVFAGVLLAMVAASAVAQIVDTAALRITQPLMENWQFAQNDDLTDEQALASNGEGWEVVTLPHTWNAQDAASYESEGYKRGLGWYRLQFATPTSGARHWIEFGAASLVADVWLNGQHLGQHKGGATAFRFDVTDLLASGQENVLLVKADNSAPKKDDDLTAIAPRGGDFNVSGGLHRHVALISTLDSAHIDLGDLGGPGVYATTTSIEDGIVNVRTKLKNDGEAAGDYVVRVSMLDAEGQTVATIQQSVALAAEGAEEIAQDLAIPSPRLWHGRADPYLYQLVAELLSSDGTPIDKVTHPFGVREMRFDPEEGFFLNGEHMGRLNGVGTQLDLLGKGWAQNNEDYDNSFAMIMEIGANAVRLAHVPYPWYAYQKASELGLIVWAETALGIRMTQKRCSTEDAHPAFVENAQLQLQEFIRQNYNHASIATWAVGNESSQRQLSCDDPYDNVTPVLRQMHETAKSEDPSRADSYVEFPHPAEREGPFATEGITDLFGTNRYFLWYTPEFKQFGPLLDDLHELTPDQPLAVGEYGGGGALTHHTDNPVGGYPEFRSAPDGEVSYQPEEYQAYLHELNYAVLASKPYLWGSFVWNMFDFGSAHRNEGDVLGVNTKGLVAFDHTTRKDAFYFYKANWSSEPVTYIVGRRYTDRAYPVADVKVYSNGDSVELVSNGTSVGVMTADECEQRTCVFEDVALSPGLNTLTASGAGVGDTVEWSLNTADVNIAAGRITTGLITSNGTRFGSDNFFVGGAMGPGPRFASAGGPPDVRGTDDPLLYKYFRVGTFEYDIPLPDGAYEVTLGFLEPNLAEVAGEELLDIVGGGSDDGDRVGEGDRVFNVTANGALVLEDYDILAEAGASRVVVTETFPIDVVGGRLVLSFVPVVGEAIVSTIKIVRQQNAVVYQR